MRACRVRTSIMISVSAVPHRNQLNYTPAIKSSKIRLHCCNSGRCFYTIQHLRLMWSLFLLPPSMSTQFHSNDVIINERELWVLVQQFQGSLCTKRSRYSRLFMLKKIAPKLQKGTAFTGKDSKTLTCEGAVFSTLHPSIFMKLQNPKLLLLTRAA